MNWDYVAGFFDGEGHVILRRQRTGFSYGLQFTQKDPEILYLIQQFIQAGNVHDAGNAHHLVVYGKNVLVELVCELMARCIVKKPDLARLFRALRWSNGSGKQLSTEARAVIEQLCDEQKKR